MLHVYLLLMPSTKAAAFSPCNITGFFQIHTSNRRLEKIGSTGAGIALEDGVLTHVSVERVSKPKIMVSFNGRPLQRPIVSRSVVKEYLAHSFGPLAVRVSHESRLPIGCGYGTSGAGALGLSLCMNESMGSPLTRLEAARVAHEAEVRCKTGLGTVTAAFHGGFLARVKAGAPGVSQVQKLPFSKSDRVISASYGPISTSRFLSRRDLVEDVNSCGKSLVARLLKRPRLDVFLEISRGFADCLKVMTPRLSRFLKVMDQAGISASMMMIGESAFTIAHRDTVRSVAAIVKKVGLAPVTSKISFQGAHLV